MSSNDVISNAKIFLSILCKYLQDEGKEKSLYEDDLQILKMNNENCSSAGPLNMFCGDRQLFICEKAVPKVNETHEELNEEDFDDETRRSKIDTEPQPLSIMRARQLLSWYTMSQNSNVSSVVNSVLPALWVRCDMTDPAGTSWLGAETISIANKVAGVKLYSVTCKDSTVNKASLITLDELKQEHKKRHHPSSIVTKGSAQYNLFGSTVVENTTIESQSSVTVDFKWSHVESILQTPPLSSVATLNIKVASGDMRSPMFQMYRELEFLQILANGLRTGETEWMEPLETLSAVELTKTYLGELQNTANTLQNQAAKPTEAPKVKSEQMAETSIFSSLTERGDLDFVEQLWVRMRKSVTSYQDIGDCLKLVIDALKYGDIKPWIHRDSNSSLSKLILQSYHQQIEPVSLTGFTPIHMLLEMGLDKMRKDYINYLISQEWTTLNHLSYYLSTKVDAQEQVMRVRKLHHLLEIIVTGSTFLGLPYDRLFLLTQSCLQYYKTCPYDEDHDFKLPIKPTLISHFYQKEHPVSWGVEVSSGHGPREVKTFWQLSDKPLVDHITFDTYLSNETINGESEEPAYFTTMGCCSLVNFA